MFGMEVAKNCYICPRYELEMGFPKEDIRCVYSRDFICICVILTRMNNVLWGDCEYFSPKICRKRGFLTGMVCAVKSMDINVCSFFFH